jgi:hypothetical protein
MKAAPILKAIRQFNSSLDEWAEPIAQSWSTPAVRENTERPVTAEVGTNVLAGTKREPILLAIRQQLAFRGMRQIPEKWDGKSGARIVQILAAKLMSGAPPLPALETSIAPLQKNAR